MRSIEKAFNYQGSLSLPQKACLHSETIATKLRTIFSELRQSPIFPSPWLFVIPSPFLPSTVLWDSVEHRCPGVWEPLVLGSSSLAHGPLTICSDSCVVFQQQLDAQKLGNNSFTSHILGCIFPPPECFPKVQHPRTGGGSVQGKQSQAHFPYPAPPRGASTPQQWGRTQTHKGRVCFWACLWTGEHQRWGNESTESKDTEDPKNPTLCTYYTITRNQK